MSLLVRFFISFCVLAPIWAFAQSFQYKIEGSFMAQGLGGASGSNSAYPVSPALPNTIPVISDPGAVTVNFTIRWNESANVVQGIYQDNYFSTAPNVVSGNVMNIGRNFTVILPAEVNGAKTIVIRTSQTGAYSGSVPATIMTMNNVGGTLYSENTFGYMSSLSNSINEIPGSGCSIGFGSLTGFCGLYGGNMTEISDSGNRCDLLLTGSPRLELGTDTKFKLYLNYSNSINNIPFHDLGTFTASPDGLSVTVSRRECGPLPGTNFPDNNCKILMLNSSFFNTAGNITMSGNYTITDELSGEACSYNMFFNRQTVY